MRRSAREAFGLFFATALALTALAGCSDEPAPGGASGGAPDGTSSGGSDTAGLGADGQGGTPDSAPSTDTTGDATATPEPECKEDTDCEAASVCDCHGVCVPKGATSCEEDKNCGATSTNFCNKCTGFCELRRELCQPCEHDFECKKDGSACLDLASGGRVCGLVCLSDVGCPKGFVCQQIANVGEKQCIPQSGSCASPGECAEDVDCPFPEICNKDQLLCAEGCPDDDACSGELVCTAGHCVTPCDEPTNPCKAGQECMDGHCKIPGGCIDASECPLAETYCHPDTHMCTPGCLSDFDCKASAKVCKDGGCVDKGCDANFWCAFEQVCNLDSGKCEQAVGPYCDACDQQQEDQCGGGKNLCAGFQDEEGNELGDFCLVECGPDAANPCPQGYACTELEVEEGDKRRLCTRNCPVPPVGAATN